MMEDKIEIKKILQSRVTQPEDVDYRNTLIEYLLDDMGTIEDIESVISDLNNHRPIQYISGVSHFYGYQFYVDESVLIPRPETEELVHLIDGDMKKLSNEKNESIRLLDIGTGSGIIPICLKLKNKDWHVEGVDISNAALTVAQKNATDLKVDVLFRELNILDYKSSKSLGIYDVIVSNPPYIPVSEKELMSENVLGHEPHLALFVEDEDPLLFYREVGELAVNQLVKGGSLYFELNEYNAEAVVSLLNNMGFRSIQLINDMQGKYRICKAKK